MNREVMFSSKYDAWATPQDFFNKLNDIFNFDIDVCAEPNTAKCDMYWTKNDDCLSIDWKGYGDKNLDGSPTCYMNPPYGREIGKFVAKAAEEAKKGCEIVALLPARTDTRWFHNYIWDKERQKPKENIYVDLIPGRLKFGTDEYWQWVWEQEYIRGKKNSLYKRYGVKNSAPFPSMTVIFNPRSWNIKKFKSL